MSTIADAEADTRHHATMISPRQAAFSALFGGPIGFVYFTRRNYLAVDDIPAARKTSAMCVPLVLAWNAAIALAVLIRKPLPIFLGVAFEAMPFVLMIAAYRIARRQVKLSERHPISFCSDLSVLGRATLCALASAACSFAAILIALLIAVARSGFR